VRKINKKTLSSKSNCHHSGTCRQYKQYRELLNRYANWCSDKITKKEMQLVRLYGSRGRTFSLEEQTKLLELEKERLEAMFLFYSIENSESKDKLEEILRKKIRRINLDARKIIDFLDINVD